MSEQITATYAILQWCPVKSGVIDGIDSCHVRDSSIVRITFACREDKDAYPARLRQAIEERGGELILCNELDGRYK